MLVRWIPADRLNWRSRRVAGGAPAAPVCGDDEEKSYAHITLVSYIYNSPQKPYLTSTSKKILLHESFFDKMA